MDFSKYNKWLRYYAAIFDLNPDVFNTEKFVDVTVVNNKSIGVIYSNLYDQYIIQELTYNRFSIIVELLITKIQDDMRMFLP